MLRAIVAAAGAAETIAEEAAISLGISTACASQRQQAVAQRRVVAQFH